MFENTLEKNLLDVLIMVVNGPFVEVTNYPDIRDATQESNHMNVITVQNVLAVQIT